MTSKPRARELGIPLEGTPGPYNAITDVSNVEVGFATLIEGESVRTGVTAIHPRGKTDHDPVFGGIFSFNGNGEMTGAAWVEEGGFVEGPICITNTHSVGVVRDTVIDWQVKNKAMFQKWSVPVVAETADGWLNDMNGFHVRPEHVLQALDTAKSGPIPEGQRWRRHRHDLLRIQRRNRHIFTKTSRKVRRLHRRRVGAGQLRPPLPVDRGRRTGRPSHHRGCAFHQRRKSFPGTGFADRHSRHRCAALSVSTQTGRQTSYARHGADGQPGRQWQRGYLPGLFNGQPGCSCPVMGVGKCTNPAKRSSRSYLCRSSPGNRGSHPECHARRRINDRQGWSACTCVAT